MITDTDRTRLTPKQHRFAELVASGVDQSDAYRQAYHVKASTLPATVHRSAHDVASNPKVAAAIEKLRAENADAAQVSVSKVVAELMSTAQQARAAAQFSAAVNAYTSIARILGYLSPARGNTTVGGQHVHLHGEPTGNPDALRELLARMRSTPANQQSSALAMMRRELQSESLPSTDA